MTMVYYLQWHRADCTDNATDLFHEFHLDPPKALTDSVFDAMYEEVAAVHTNDLEQLFAEWNRGSGHESEAFKEARYCERCETYIEGSREAVTHAVQNHEYNAFHEAGTPDYVRGVRSMSVGDIVQHGNTHYACAPISWKPISIIEGEY